jgi:anti-sigma-K factor RskA
MMIESDSNFRSDILELIAGDALGELDASERQMLAEQLTDDDKLDADELQLTAGALQLVYASQDLDEMPTSLRTRIASTAPNYLSRTAPAAPAHSIVYPKQSPGISRRERLAWLVAAASVLIAIGLWASNRPAFDSPTVAMNPARARSELIARANDRIEIAWTDGTTPFDTPVSGDVVWSNALQQGFLRFVGMPVNDPSLQQYQLWIIDPLRDDQPIDGGVFDVTTAGEVVIPIDAKLTVIDPAAFAVTIEKPGGVVVSDQTRLPLLAKVVR